MLCLTVGDDSVEMKIQDLPETVSEEKIMEFLYRFGEMM